MKNKNLLYVLYILLMASLLFLNVGCSDDETTEPPVPVNESEILLNHFETTNDYVHTSGTFVVSASDVRTTQLTNPTSQKLVDIRSATDFAAGHIEGAVNVPFSNLYDYIKTLNPADFSRIVIICYSGQTSAYAVSLVRAIGGYNNAISLKWGMSSWDSVFATNYWLAKLSNIRAGSFVTTPSPAKNPKGDLPVINTGKTTAPDILEARIKQLLADGYPAATIAENTVYSNLSNYYIVNYWSPALYANPGHIDGAINYDPGTQPFKSANDLMTLPTSKTSVLYCFTGQTSSYVGAYLRMLGYDVKSLTYGANSMIYDIMLSGGVANTFIPATEIKGYPYVTGP
ncbi:MAG TPA: rhodanese-like domain-containing protein [Ignavibacteriaceae bacterium]|nr:rhodanese-like domain-containing protein [Ignavibacteriaceae bacterium]